jgi:hypothetical protein
MTPSKATQDFIPIKEVRDGIISLKNGSLASVIMVSSVNFMLKSQDEQDAIIFQFQNFLNSLDFSIQISIQSRELDIRPYIASLEARYKNELGDLMKIQIREYINFIRNFVDQSNIMTKNFFVIVPFTPAIIDTKKTLGKTSSSQDKFSNFEENRTQLEQRINTVSQGLTRCGLRSIQLGTEEVVELLYKTLNPGDLEKPIIPA